MSRIHATLAAAAFTLVPATMALAQTAAPAPATTPAPATAMSPVQGDDRDPTPEERTQIEQTLRTDGFTSWEEIELDDGVWEVDDAVAADGQKFDVKLDAAFAIIERDPD